MVAAVEQLFELPDLTLCFSQGGNPIMLGHHREEVHALDLHDGGALEGGAGSDVCGHHQEGNLFDEFEAQQRIEIGLRGLQHWHFGLQLSEAGRTISKGL